MLSSPELTVPAVGLAVWGLAALLKSMTVSYPSVSSDLGSML